MFNTKFLLGSLTTLSHLKNNKTPSDDKSGGAKFTIATVTTLVIRKLKDHYTSEDEYT